ncbi:MAG: VWA domain-containing protein [Phycisphaerales bacterium]|nr:VWA domain-containing protein [Phycisphaerales bacterium]
MFHRHHSAAMLVVVTGVLFVPGAHGQVVIIDPIVPPMPGPVPKPMPWPEPMPRPEHWRRGWECQLELKSQSYTVDVVDGAGVTKVDQTFHNPYPNQIEGTYVYPLPGDASISGFSMFVDGKEIKGEVLERDKAAGIYRDIVSKMRDPALLWYVGERLYKASIFPIPGNGDVRVKLQYTQTLAIDGGLSSMRLPLKATTLGRRMPDQTSVVVNIESQVPIKSVFSPTHSVAVNRKSDNRISASYESTGGMSDQDFVLHYLLSREDFGLTLLTYRDAGEDGYFMARIAPRMEIDNRDVMAKDVALVMDTSGSMSGRKIEQARDALRFCLNNLNRQDRFTVIPFSHEPKPFREGLIDATAENVDAAVAFVEKISAGGGTNIHEAVLMAMKAAPGANADRPYLIVFVTDGLPTIGQTDVDAILKDVSAANASRVRLFAFGVGDDVNTKLLDRLAEDNRGSRDYVALNEDLEIKLSSFYRKVANPVLGDLKLVWNGTRTYDVFPRELPDIFVGSEIVVMGRYDGAGTCSVELTGTRRNKTEQFVYERTLADRETGHDFLPRLWAIRKIGYLLDEIRLHGEGQELKDEVVRLATRFGVVTPYTSYLVTEDKKFASAPAAVGGRFEDEMLRLAGSDRGRGASRKSMALALTPGEAGITYSTGVAAIDLSQSANDMREAGGLDILRGLAHTDGAAAGPTARRDQQLVSMLGGRTYYFHEERWVDGSYDEKVETKKIELFSADYFALLGKHAYLAKVLALGDRVVFQSDGVWYETVMADWPTTTP